VRDYIACETDSNVWSKIFRGFLYSSIFILFRIYDYFISYYSFIFYSILNKTKEQVVFLTLTFISLNWKINWRYLPIEYWLLACDKIVWFFRAWSISLNPCSMKSWKNWWDLTRNGCTSASGYWSLKSYNCTRPYKNTIN